MELALFLTPISIPTLKCKLNLVCYIKKPRWVKGKFGSALEFDGKPRSMGYVLIEENIGTFSEMTFCA